MAHAVIRRGFTLVELLVVVAIIVILIALIVPGMERAIYQADLARCAAQLKAIGTGATTYAVQFDRVYPHRPTQQPGRERRMMKVSEKDANGVMHDDRPLIRDFIHLKQLVDPLCLTIDLSPEVTQTDPHIYSSYDLWFGVKYDGQEEGLTRLGDRVNWGTQSSNVIASDTQAIADFGTTPYTQNSHPDSQNVFSPWATQREAQAHVYTLWGTLLPRAGIGTQERSFAHTDGAVSRLNYVKIDLTTMPVHEWDERLMRLPGRGFGGPDGEGLWLYVTK